MCTIGDQYGADCPTCGGYIYDLWDYGIPLESGALLACPHCTNPFIVAEIRDDHYVVLEKQRNACNRTTSRDLPRGGPRS